MWKLITEDKKTYVEKICNECGELIEVFDGTHPLTQYLVFDLRAHEGQLDLQTLDMGLQPYHWHPISKQYPYCLVPLKTITREQQQEKDDEEIRKKNAPYKNPKVKTQPHRGRPPKYVAYLPDEIEREQKRKEKRNQDDTTNNV